MGTNYRQLSEEERDTLVILYNRGRSLRAIARFLGRSAGSLSREIRRNSSDRGYRPHQAQRLARTRLSVRRQRPRLKSPALRRQVEGLLQRSWSPEIIAGWLAREHGRPVISHEAIYQWIYKDARPLAVHLARTHRRRHRRFSRKWPRIRLQGRVPLAQRPPEAHDRRQPGHWETDLVVGSGRSALQVAVERQTRLTRLTSLPAKTAQAAYQGLRRLLTPVPPALRRSITYDNGSENALHQELNQVLGTRSYFCAPYHSWEKGTVEQTNGLIRRLLPKRTNFDTLSPGRSRPNIGSITGHGNVCSSNPRLRPTAPSLLHFNVECGRRMFTQYLQLIKGKLMSRGLKLRGRYADYLDIFFEPPNRETPWGVFPCGGLFLRKRRGRPRGGGRLLG
jgi:transposase, IS30 family